MSTHIAHDRRVSPDRTIFQFGYLRNLIDNSALLIVGAVGALIWANVAAGWGSESYQHFVHWDITSLWASNHVADGVHAAGSHAAGSHGLTLHFVVNDVLMALFFAIAAKEVWESMLPGGALANPRQAATPLLATLGGILGPVAVYLSLAWCMGGTTMADFGNGWAVPCATDIAFSYLIAKYIFGASHPAIAFLLLLAIADDAAGLVILAICYPQAAIQPQWLLLTVAAIGSGLALRKMKVHSHWAYLLGPGTLCWTSFYMANLHPALGLIPIIPTLPHAATDLGIFAKAEWDRHDTLNEFEHFWKLPVEFVLGAFGLLNAGVVIGSLGGGTTLVLAGLMIGKPLGITGMTWFAEKVLGLEKPAAMTYRHVFTLGMVAAIGFTVALFVSVAAFGQPGAIQDSVKMGALLSFAAAPVAIGMARAFRIRAWVDRAAGADVDLPTAKIAGATSAA